MGDTIIHTLKYTDDNKETNLHTYEIKVTMGDNKECI